jgi:hypothetical protein
MRNPNNAPTSRGPTSETTNSAGDQNQALQRFGVGNWAALAILLIFLGLATAFAVYVWNQLEGVDISTQGWIAMSLGIIFTAAIGIGLMALIFYSNRKNYDR